MITKVLSLGFGLIFLTMPCSAPVNLPDNSKENISQAFIEWAKAKNETDEYCSEQQCLEDLDLQGKGLDPVHGCGYRIAEKINPEAVFYTDFNTDGITDAIIIADFQQCMYGTWFINVAKKGLLTFFISKENGEYEVIEEPGIIEKSIEMGRITGLNKDTILADGGRISGENGIHNVDITWEASFLYGKDGFRLVSKTNEVKKY